MSIKRNALPSDVLEDLRALEVALSRWRLAKGDDPPPPELQAWRDTVAARLGDLDYAGREPGEPYGVSASWWYPGRLQEIGFIFETQAQLNLPSRRRPTLSEYDNRRTQHVDRYSFGIYAGKHCGEIAATFTNGTLSSVEVPDFEGSDIRGNWLMRGYVAAWLEELCQQEQPS